MSFNVGAHESTGNANGAAEETVVNNLEHAAADNNAESILGADSVPSSESNLDSEQGDSEARFVTAHSEIEDDDPDDSFYDAPEIGNDAIQLEVAAELDMNELEIAAPSDESDEDQIDEDIELDNFVIVNIPAGATDSDDSDDESISDRDITYDRSMPSGHMYLGEDLEDVHGRTLFEEGAEVVLPAHSQFGIVLVPGQVMPLHLSDLDEVAMMRTAMEHQKAIAFLHQRRRRQGGMRLLGTTADILSINSDNPNDPTAMVKAITRGQQRFELIKLERQITGVRMARIRIMNETRCSEPLDTVIPASHRRQRVSGLVKPSRRVCVHNEPSYLTAWPPWVYTQYSPKVLMERLKKEIKKQWGEQTFSSVENITSPDQLAFWVAENIPMSPKSKSYILQLTSNVQILRYELHLIQQICLDNSQLPHL
ncbi:protein cereblon-like isoform X2 [Watersipora subatra]|uniref:protein cereblon-like isoform X2 n=1 Tax=Watersipora subatra TaxID=2589382 RepID=UPI00355C497B